MLRSLPALTALLLVLIAAAMGWLPHVPGFALGTFVMALIAVCLPRTWAMFAILAAVNCSDRRLRPT